MADVRQSVFALATGYDFKLQGVYLAGRSWL